MTEQITRTEFERMLMDPDVPDSALRPYVMIDPLESQALQPSVVVNPDRVAAGGLESAMALGSLNKVARWRRNQRYRARVAKGWSGPKVVAEGDSWFQYPLLLDDVIDHLSDRWAIYDNSAAGDLLRDMARQDEIGVSVRSEKPDYLLLSGGGNDVLGGGSLERHVASFKAGLRPEDYVQDTFDALLSSTMRIYADIIETGLSAGAGKVVCHCYDYALPNSGRWLGRPLAKLGINDPGLQRAILHILIDRFHDSLIVMARKFGGRVRIADTRRTVDPGNWYDELHPTSVGYAGPAQKIRAAANAGGGLESVDVIVPKPVERPLDVADTEAVSRLLDTSEDRLLDELGRRQTILELDPGAADTLSLELTTGGVEGVGDVFRKLGGRVLARQQRELYALLCGDDPATKGEREKLRGALNLSDTALTGALAAAMIAVGCPPFVAPLIAAVIVRRGIYPAYEETCRLWGESIAADDQKAAAPAP
ncbi:hypothetical protein MLD63_07290 [Paracoccus sp. TK19116]|uniref:SGNH hydrolase-type esterase domain-containing protein n=1 Tax=Paracoccus albicereus TaxID=2922394 RepID=A0ABT1MPK1_9RHOB|nr:hypothetical protein [Paracoccus albicereus]MCQ0970223.1 hypothetical protein [Paracoccus albicereus]